MPLRPFALLFLILLVHPLFAQAQAQDTAAAVRIDFQEALKRARQYGTQIESANIVAQLAKEDVKQARAASLPQVSGLNQFIYTEGNGTPSGVFVANDGVHVYNEQLMAHEELLALIRGGEIRLAEASAAVARAKVDVAARGLNTTVAQAYYAIVSDQRKAANAEAALAEAQRFVEITRDEERGGEAAHADVIKAQLQLQQRERDLQDARLAVQKAKIALAVLIFPALNLNYTVVDDLAAVSPVPAFGEVTALAYNRNPDVSAARANVSEAQLGITVARYAYLPSFGLDVFYGIDANQFAARTDYPTQATGRSTLQHYEVPYRQNLGYVAQATLTIPLWNWGSIRSKVKQASLREHQAELDLTLANRDLQAQLSTAWQEAQAAFSQVESLHSSSDLAAESLRLTLLRYQAGEATALEVVDAQATATQARNAYDDGLLRYRLASTDLQILTGTL